MSQKQKTLESNLSSKENRGGKAEQIFLRGFDVDHGTDVAINVDGMPVNMVSHAHGQGYADLHFVIPETIENRRSTTASSPATSSKPVD